MSQTLLDGFTVSAGNWGGVLLDATVKGVILLAMAGLVTLVLRRAPAATRHFIWTVAVSAVVMLPFIGAVAPKWNLTVLPAKIAPSSVTPSSIVPSNVQTGTRPDAVSSPVPTSASPNAPPKAAPLASPNAPPKAAPLASPNAPPKSAPLASPNAPPESAPLASPNAPPKSAPLATPRRDIPQSATAALPDELQSARSVLTPSAAPSAPRTARDWWMVVSMIWITGTVLLLFRLILGLWGTARLARRSEVVQDPRWIALTSRLARQLGITRPVTLLRSEHSGIPMTWGVLYPVVLLPGESNDWAEERRVIVLLHELAHVRRFDALTQTLAQFAGALFWVNPLIWIAARQMRTERERACDDFVLTAGMRPSAYASDLLEIVRTMGSEPALSYAALAMARRSEFEGRLLAILDPTARRVGMGRVGKAATAVTALCLLLPLAGMRPAARSAVSPALPLVSSSAVSSDRAFRDSSTTRPLEKATSSDVNAVGINATDGNAIDVNPSLSSTKTRGDSATGFQAFPELPKFSAFAALAVDSTVRDSSRAMSPALVAGSSLPRDDKQTLILVVRAAAKMTSDHEKASLLVEIVDRFVGDDSLRAAFLATTATITSDHEKQRVLSSLLGKDALSDYSRVLFIRTAAGISSEYTKGQLLTSFAKQHELTNASVRGAFFAAAATLGSGYDQQQLLVSVLGRLKKLTRDEALGVLSSARKMSSSSSKAAVLVAVADKIGLDDATVRQAYLDVASTMTSDSDYRKAMSAAVKVPQ